VGPRAGLHTEATGKILSPLPGIKPRSPGRPARSQTLVPELTGLQLWIAARQKESYSSEVITSRIRPADCTLHAPACLDPCTRRLHHVTSSRPARHCCRYLAVMPASQPRPVSVRTTGQLSDRPSSVHGITTRNNSVTYLLVHPDKPRGRKRRPVTRENVTSYPSLPFLSL
jgi:hypothetical protein